MSGYSTLVAAFLPNIGARFDEVIIGMLLRLKNGLVVNKFCDHIRNESIRHFIGGRSVHAIRSGHAAKALVDAFVRYPAATSWAWQDLVLQAVSRSSFVGLRTDVIRHACHNFCLLCINDIDLFGRVGCDDAHAHQPRRSPRTDGTVQRAV